MNLMPILCGVLIGSGAAAVWAAEAGAPNDAQIAAIVVTANQVDSARGAGVARCAARASFPS